MASWNIMAMRLPRMRFSSAGAIPSSSAPRKRALPVARPFAARSPITVRNVWLLPDPDSPTTPTVSPSAIAKDTSLTALTSPSGMVKRVLRFLTSSSATMLNNPCSTVLGVEGVAQPVADEVEAEQGGGEENGGEHQHPGRGLHLGSPVGDEHAPARVGLLYAEAEEGQEALDQDDLRDGEGHIHDHRADAVGDDMAADDLCGGDAARNGRLDELAALDRQCLAAHDAGRGEPFDGSNRHEDQHDVAAKKHHQQDHEEQERQRIEDVDQAHHDAIDAAAEIARDGAVGDA